MFQRRRRSAAATAGNDLPFCGMCGQAIRVDSNGRCALGHRVAAPVVAAEPVAPVATDLHETTVALTPLSPTGVDDVETVEHDFGPLGQNFVDSYDDGIVWGRSQGDISAPAPADALDEFIAWDEPATPSISALDVDTDALPVADVVAPPAPLAPATPFATDALNAPDVPAPAIPATQSRSGNLLDELDELDDAAHARRTAVGTIGATIVVSAMVFVAVAALPF